MLDAEELAAIRGAIGQALSAATKNIRTDNKDASPIALISDDQAGERARPDALRIAGRWVPFAKTRFIRGLGIKLEMAVGGAEIAAGAFLRDELIQSWTRMVDVRGRDGSCLITVSGPVIEMIAGRLLGDSSDATGADERAPSAASLSVFKTAGEMLIAGLADAWREEQAIHISAKPIFQDNDAARRELLENEALLVVTLTVTSPANGRVRLVMRPETAVAPPPATRVSPPSPELLERALGDVKVEVCVDLGTARLTMAEIADLKPGSLITLHQSVDSHLPVRCAGVVKAFGRPTIWKGALAVEIAAREGTNQ